MNENNIIQQKIHEVRAEMVMLDFDLALLYEVDTKILNQAVKRNIDRFPEDFMFRLNQKEWESIMSQNVIESQSKRKNTLLPFAFTEHGVAMISGVLKSEKAIKMNISIIRLVLQFQKLTMLFETRNN
jgi:hypothetical protein